ncbi:protein arginine N-methyltransferase 7 isoform X1 [Rhodamnia argentea]|uniref:Protein arginine N-methyltransferase 7 isoform X1 n=1 Tax=Rhodamnia argentea TaxID=178133 RepID=A0A8B8NSK4_9MYRT|nr:protein arginine N-methyltransferase 7 isoform X1 [Rhodamnia argentea]
MAFLTPNCRLISSARLLSASPSAPRLRFAHAQAMSSCSTQRVFQLKLDPLTGNSEWVVIEEDAGETAPESLHKGLLARTSYLDMLNDAPRNKAFREAIDKAITRPCRVLDIGAGTGLLSMMAARTMGLMDSPTCHGNNGSVTACESYLPMVKLMRKILRANDMAKSITVLNKRSDEVRVGVDIDSRADVLVSEILDSELLGEGLVPTLQHAHDMLLVENPVTVPYKAIVYGQLVESTYLWKLHDLYNNEAEISDGIHLVPAGLERIIGVKLQQHPMHCDAIKREIKLLSEPFRIFEFNFGKRPESHGETAVHVKATGSGQVNAVISWWMLQLDEEGSIHYSTAPKWITSSGAGNWCDHWKQCVWFIPGKGVPLAKDEEISLRAVHGDTSISYQLEPHQPISTGQDHNVKGGDFCLPLSPERIAIYGDAEWRHSVLNAIKTVLQRRAPSLCIIADDSVFLALLVARLSIASHIMALFPGLQDKGIHYLKAVADANGFSMDRVEFVRKKTANWTVHDTHKKTVDLLIAEPFYYGSDGMLPWQNLRFWNERTALDSLLSKDASIMPCKGLLKVCAMSLPDLWNSRRSLEKIEGFDHSMVNATLGACGDAADGGPCLPFFVWQCGEVKELSQIVTVMEFDFSRAISPCQGKAKVKFSEKGICHGLVLWIDWVMDAEYSTVVSTGPDQRYWKQGVKLLPTPVAAGFHGSTDAGEASCLIVETSFDPSNGELVIKHIPS